MRYTHTRTHSSADVCTLTCTCCPQEWHMVLAIVNKEEKAYTCMVER